MKQIFSALVLISLWSNASAQSNELKKRSKMTNLIDNQGDKLFSTIYPNLSKETIILLHGGPGFPSDLLEVVEIFKDSFQIITFSPERNKTIAL